MAAFDYIYGDFDDWCDLLQWLAGSKRPQYCRYLYTTPVYGQKDKKLFNAPWHVDAWVYENCPLKNIKKSLRKMYGCKSEKEAQELIVARFGRRRKI